MKKRRGNSGISLLKQAATVSDGGDCKKMGEIERKVVVLVKYEALPEYMKDNEYIRNHYRCEWPLKDVVFSVFSLHNETFNIWTHLVGFFIFMWLMIMSLLTANMSIENVMATLFQETSDGWLTSVMTNQSNGSISFFTDSSIGHLTKSPILDTTKDSGHSLPLWPWLVFLTGAISCLIFSSISHLFGCHSRRFHYFFWRLDYAGISVMIVCSFFAPIYYTFSDHPFCRFLYLSSITLFGILVVATLLSPALSSGRFRSFRATLFLCMGFSGLIPAAHAAILHSDQPQVLLSLVYEIVMGLLYGIGAVFYVTRIPERWKPGAFDIVGHSHQIFHVFVVAAALAHSYAILVIMEWRQGLPA